MSPALRVPRIATLWRETITRFITHSGLVHASVWGGFAVTVAAIQDFRSLTRLTAASDRWVFVADAVAGFLLNALARGARAWSDALRAVMASGRGPAPARGARVSHPFGELLAFEMKNHMD